MDRPAHDATCQRQHSRALERLPGERRPRLDPGTNQLQSERFSVLMAVRSPSSEFAASQSSFPSLPPKSRSHSDDQQRSTQSADDRRSGWQIQFVGSVQADDARRGRGQPADEQLGLERIDQKICAHGWNDQIGENHKNSADPDEACHDKSEEDVKQEIPCSHGYAFRNGALRLKGNHQKSLAKQQWDDPDDRIQGERPEHLAWLNEQDVTHQSSFEFLVAFRALAEQENGRRRCDHKDDADQSFLWHTVVPCSRQCEDRRANNRKSERPRVSLPVMPMSKENGDTDSQRRHLRQRKVHKNDFTENDMQTVIDENSR